MKKILRALITPPRGVWWVLIPACVAIAIIIGMGLPKFGHPEWAVTNRTLLDRLTWFPRPAPGDWDHFPIFGLLGWTLRWSIGAWRRDGWHLTLWAWAIASTYAVAMEAYQEIVPGRYVSGTDALLSIAGITIALLWYEIARAWLRTRP